METAELGWRETGKRGQPRTLRRTLRPSDFFAEERMEKWVLIQFRQDRPPPPAPAVVRLRLRVRVRASCSSMGSSDKGARRFIRKNGERVIWGRKRVGGVGYLKRRSVWCVRLLSKRPLLPSLFLLPPTRTLSRVFFTLLSLFLNSFRLVYIDNTTFPSPFFSIYLSIFFL